MTEELKITKAAEGGFVITSPIRSGLTSGPIYAGSLDDCLAYLRRALEPSQGYSGPLPDMQAKCGRCGGRFPPLGGCEDAGCPWGTRPATQFSEWGLDK